VELSIELEPCKCYRPPFFYTDFTTVDLGCDEYDAEVSIDTCITCKTLWLKYLIEQPQYTKAGRWWRAPISLEEAEKFDLDSARKYVEAQQWCFIGGSFYDGIITKQEAPVTVM
jgi:hypothetical protein